MFTLMFTVTVLLLLLVQTECSFSGDTCYVDGQDGICQPLSKCAIVFNEIIRAGNPMPMHMRRKALRLHCGFELKEPLVCCVSSVAPQDDILGTVPVPVRTTGEDNIAENFTKTLENKNGPADITAHRNLNLLPDQCGFISINADRISGGNSTQLNEMPWMALLSYESASGLQFNCGGTIINKWYILTAAHCVSFLGNKIRLHSVILGEHDTKQDPDCDAMGCAPKVMNITIHSIIAHPGYTHQTLADDIALIRLSQPADFTRDNIKPICLPITPELQGQSMSGEDGMVTGWGITENGRQSSVLLAVYLPILLPNECHEAYNRSLAIRNSQICAGGTNDIIKDACIGDSGGPLMLPGMLNQVGVRHVQRGIVSFGSKKCGIGYPGVYTNVAYYMDWILDHIRS